jgi:hypothetical protein
MAKGDAEPKTGGPPKVTVLKAVPANYDPNHPPPTEGCLPGWEDLAVASLLASLLLGGLGVAAGSRSFGAGPKGHLLSAGRNPQGAILGWGTGQSAEAVQQTEQLAQNLTQEQLNQMIKNGLSRQWVEEQLALYNKAIAEGGAKLLNQQLLPRQQLMTKILQMWSK